MKKDVSAWLGFSVLLIAIWAVVSFLSGELVAFWPAIPIGIWGAVIAVSSLVTKPRKDD